MKPFIASRGETSRGLPKNKKQEKRWGVTAQGALRNRGSGLRLPDVGERIWTSRPFNAGHFFSHRNVKLAEEIITE